MSYKPVPGWHFWNPQSGLVGGIICGLFICAFACAVIAASIPTCPKSGGEQCECIACECPDGCPGVCLADTIMRAGGVVTMYADPVAKECGEYGVFARVEANGKDGEPCTVAISMKDTAGEAFADLVRQMKLDAQPCCEVGEVIEQFSVVQLRSGGPSMTVVYCFPDETTVRCNWHDYFGAVQMGDFNKACLREINSEAGASK